MNAKEKEPSKLHLEKDLGKQNQTIFYYIKGSECFSCFPLKIND